MKIIVVGGGKVGSTLCEQLVAERHDVVLIDQDERTVASVVDDYDVNAIVGNGVSTDIQREAGVQNADLVISCTPSDELNILTSMVAKKIGAKQTIARVRNPQYFNVFLSQDLGLNLMVNPEYLAAQEISRILNFPYATHVEDIGDGSSKLIEYRLPKGSPLVGIALRDMGQTFGAHILICTVRRGDETIVPQGSFELAEGDVIYVSAATDDLYKLFRNAKVSAVRNKNVYILGGSRVAFYLAQSLAKDYAVTVIERDEKVCADFYEALPASVKVVCANGYDQRELLAEGVSDTDVVVALSNDDEKNILISMFTKAIGKRTIVKVDKTEYVGMLEKMGINSAISPKHLTANQIVRFVRALRSGKGGVVYSVYKTMNSGAEFVEFEVGKDFAHEGVLLKDLKLKKNTILVSITHDGKTVVPSGLSTIQCGDHIVVATQSTGLTDFNEVFE